jgi:hypothetical protein
LRLAGRLENILKYFIIFLDLVEIFRKSVVQGGGKWMS